MGEPIDASLVLIKPDAIQKGLTGLVIRRLDEARLQMAGAKISRVSRALAIEHYQALKEKPFFEDLIQHLCGTIHHVDHVLAFVYMGPGAIAKIRAISGATHPEKADPMSLRGALGRMTAAGIMENVLHASATPEEAEREIKLWFHPEELLEPIYPTRPSKPAARLEWAA